MAYKEEAEFRLRDYSMEIGLWEPITLQELIESHRSLRKNNITFTQHLREAIVEAREEAYKQAYKDKVENGFISIDDLRSMTVSELCALVEK